MYYHCDLCGYEVEVDSNGEADDLDFEDTMFVSDGVPTCPNCGERLVED